MNVNKVILVGRLTRDPEIRNTSSGQTVASVSLATNRFWKDKNGQKQDKTEYHNVVLWGRLAEIVGQYLTKGQEAYFEGRMETRKYTGKDGIEKRYTEVVAENMQLGSRAQNSAPRAFTPSTPNQQPKQAAPVAEEIPTINLDDEQDEVKIEDVPF
ncbi:MAG: single-stranded DNA-binding protein [Candidatus Moranbacteria bacterium CG10_big_fil_rev_8_21_14_0_10_35_21]|nr:MAG: single-stranded DNA-binding protein [Candidatus Moranbacteria bacterium CG10_big_fil_rev_8_21_14_0_10_35_21]PJA88443.1 MAG: single-stranded DNA-binding protein [Candidatus Moranbacteria bacterium CG_4_9_14_3_um_filter_36_9]